MFDLDKDLPGGQQGHRDVYSGPRIRGTALVKLSPHEDDSMSEVKKRKVHSAEFKAKVGM